MKSMTMKRRVRGRADVNGGRGGGVEDLCKLVVLMTTMVLMIVAVKKVGVVVVAGEGRGTERESWILCQIAASEWTVIEHACSRLRRGCGVRGC